MNQTLTELILFFLCDEPALLLYISTTCGWRTPLPSPSWLVATVPQSMFTILHLMMDYRAATYHSVSKHIDVHVGEPPEEQGDLTSCYPVPSLLHVPLRDKMADLDAAPCLQPQVHPCALSQPDMGLSP